MATALFIKREDFVRNTIVDGSVDQDKYQQFIKGAQIMHIRNYLGTDLYDKISNDIIAGTMTADYQHLLNEYIQPMLIHFTMVDYLPFANYALKNGGVFKHSSETGETASKEEVDYLVQRHRDQAEYYAQRFVTYMTHNYLKYPEYRSNTNEDIRPDREVTFNGWVL